MLSRGSPRIAPGGATRRVAPQGLFVAQSAALSVQIDNDDGVVHLQRLLRHGAVVARCYQVPRHAHTATGGNAGQANCTLRWRSGPMFHGAALSTGAPVLHWSQARSAGGVAASVPGSRGALALGGFCTAIRHGGTQSRRRGQPAAVTEMLRKCTASIHQSALQ